MQNRNRAVITQPDFFPWMGAFDKMAKCDVFVFLDHVTNRPSDGLWTKRVKVLINKEAKWLSVPLKKDPAREFVPINEMVIDTDNNPRIKDQHLNTIRGNYGKHPYFREVFPLVEEYYQMEEKRIAVKNQWFFEEVSRRTGILKPVFLSSNLNCTAASNELLIEICGKIGASEYLYGTGSLNYLNDALWKEKNIELIPQDFSHPQYVQLNSSQFVPGLSVLDILMNHGFGYLQTTLNN